MKHVKHTSEMHETYGCKRLVDAEFDAMSDAEATGAKLIDGTGLSSGRSRRMGAQSWRAALV
jgi:hypothetical protein